MVYVLSHLLQFEPLCPSIPNVVIIKKIYMKRQHQNFNFEPLLI